MESIDRRTAIKKFGLVAGLTLVGMPSFSQTKENDDQRDAPTKPLKIVVVGAHPDDPETTCGGTMALFAKAGHQVVSAYLTLGEAGVEGKTYDEAATIRLAELREACQILNVRPEWLGQIDGSCEINASQYKIMHNFLKKENPDLVFTHWPIDGHRDHRVCSSLVFDVWIAMQQSFDLYYSEAMTGTQTQLFNPTDYVDISAVVIQKHQACFAHKSQRMETHYPDYHGPMELFRGMEYHCKYAEAFIRHPQKTTITII